MRKYNFLTQNDYLFIGAIGDDSAIEKLNSLGGNVSTGYNVQRKMMDGLESLGYYSDAIIGHVSPPFHMKSLVINFASANRNENVTDISIGFINLPIIDKIIKEFKIGKAAKKWIQGKKNPRIFVYSLASYYLIGAIKAKKLNSKGKCIVIVPDLPEYMSYNYNVLYRALKKIDRIIINHCIRQADAFILFSEKMKERLPIKDKPYVVVEGIIRNVNKADYLSCVEKRASNSERIIMLTGNLSYEEGIPQLLDAFSRIKEERCKLWLTGDGNAVNLINEYAKSDDRITYYGYINSYTEFTRLQQKAYIFVLMVSPKAAKSPYYFPSKLMEYLASGGIVACHKLSCIPKEYDEHLEYFEADTTDDVRRKLEELCVLESQAYIEKATSRYDFLCHKCPEEQMKKVEAMLKIL